MNNFKENLKYYRIGEFVACIMLKGVIHPDMQENNIGCRNGNCVLIDYADIAIFEFPDGIGVKVLNRLTDALFPPMEKILKNFELMSSFRAGFISVGGMLGKAIFDNTITNGISSFAYIDISLKNENNILSYVLTAENREILKEWQNLIMEELKFEKTQNIISNFNSELLNRVSNENSYHMNQMIVLKSYSEIDEAETDMEFWLTALHFACESIKHGFSYTGYGILRKVLRMCKHAYKPIVLYHAKIEELLEEKELKDEMKQLIEDNMNYNFFQLLWLINDIDSLMAKKQCP